LFTGLFGAATGREQYQLIYSGNPFEIIVEMFSFVFIIIGSVGYLLILKEADEQVIFEKNKKIESDYNQLEALNDKKDKFFSIISHDLKSPIGALIQLGYILQKTHTDIPIHEREELIQTISNSAKKTYNLLENLLLWSRTETGKLLPEPMKFDLRVSIEETLDLLRHNIAQKKIQVVVDLKDNIKVYADKNMVSTVFRNLISNAIKFVHENGTISISSKMNIANHNVMIRICDNGVGIDPEVLPKLFDLDSKYSTKGTQNEKGAGLGLKLCNEFITKNKGKIEVESELGNGSTFKIELKKEMKRSIGLECPTWYLPYYSSR
jgi:two-component system sensor histidine kinase/response regulator